MFLFIYHYELLKVSVISVKTLHFHALLRDPVCVYALPCCEDVLNSMLIELKQN